MFFENLKFFYTWRCSHQGRNVVVIFVTPDSLCRLLNLFINEIKVSILYKNVNIWFLSVSLSLFSVPSFLSFFYPNRLPPYPCNGSLHLQGLLNRHSRKISSLSFTFKKKRTSLFSSGQSVKETLWCYLTAWKKTGVLKWRHHVVFLQKNIFM